MKEEISRINAAEVSKSIFLEKRRREGEGRSEGGGGRGGEKQEGGREK